MTDAMATAVADPNQIQIYFGGVMDASMGGAPLYFWIIFMLGIGLICLGILAAYYRFFILDKVWDFVECYKHHKPLALIRTRYRKAYLKSLKYIAQVFVDEDGPDRWFAPALETSSNLNGVDLVECVDYYDWLQDPILNQAIFEIVDKWNEDHPDEKDKIFDPVKFQEMLSAGRLADYFDKQEVVVYSKGDVKVPAFFIVNMSKVEQYLPRQRSSSMFGGYTQHLADDMVTGQKADWKAWVIPVAALCTLIIVTSIIGFIILKTA